MKITKNWDALVVGMFLALVTAALLILVNLTKSDVAYVLLVVSGMTAMGAVTAFQHHVEKNSRENSVAHNADSAQGQHQSLNSPARRNRVSP
jgi:hypothetical protein